MPNNKDFSMTKEEIEEVMEIALIHIQSREKWHWSKSVSVTSFIIAVGWLLVGTSWVALSDDHIKDNKEYSEDNRVKIEYIQKQSITKKDLKLIEKDISANAEKIGDMSKKIDKIYDVFIVNGYKK